MVTSGVRIGTPSVTTRGFDEDDCRKTAALILRVLEAPEDADSLRAVGEEARALCESRPIYGAV